jgi:hypothetical protein
METIQNTPEILEVDSINGLAVKTKTDIQEAFLPFAQQFAEWKEKAATIVVTDIFQTDLMEQAGEARKAIKKIRTAVEKKKDELKEDSLRYGKAVQEIRNRIWKECEEIESHLEAQERFKELHDAKLLAERTNARMDRLKDFADVTSSIVAGMTDDQFESFLGGLVADRDKKIEGERLATLRYERQQQIEPYKDFIPAEYRDADFASFTHDEWQERFDWTLEQKRLHSEKLAEEKRILDLHNARKDSLINYWAFVPETVKFSNLGEIDEDAWTEMVKNVTKAWRDAEAEKKRVAEENERLRKEAEDREAEAKKQQALRDAQLKKEREARERAEAELAAKKKADDDEAQRIQDELKAEESRKAKEEKDRAAAERKAKRQPDKDKLKLHIGTLQFQKLELKTEEAQAAYDKIYAAFEKWQEESYKIAESL